MKDLKLILFTIFFGISFLSYSQEKVEREVKAKANQVPKSSRDWLFDAFEDIKRPRWFLEYSQNGKAFEAKFLRKGYFYSVKFDSLGALMDVEIEISQKEVPEQAWKVIQEYFESNFSEIKLDKIQRQLIGKEDDVEDFFDENETEGITIRYEIVFEGKNDAWLLWEGLFDENGKLISIIKVQQRSLDNLIF